VSTLAEARQAYYELSGKASDAVRQIGFAGIAIVWLFKTDSGGVVTVPDGLLVPGLLIVAGLFLDLLQYVLATVLWSAFTRRRERAGTRPDEQVSAPAAINWPANACFYLKILLILSAYVGIGLYLATHLHHDR
jgi:hypothetical protein